MGKRRPGDQLTHDATGRFATPGTFQSAGWGPVERDEQQDAPIGRELREVFAGQVALAVVPPGSPVRQTGWSSRATPGSLPVESQARS